MKSLSGKSMVVLLAGFVLAVWMALGMTGEKTALAQTDLTPGGEAVAKAGRGPNERFYKTWEILDSGGSFYMYMDTKDALKQFVEQLRPLMKESQMQSEVVTGFNIADRVIDRLGIYGVQDIGISTTPDGTLNRTKILIGSSEGRDKGLLSLLGKEPHGMSILDRAPTDTVLVISSDFDFEKAWRMICDITQDIGGAEALGQLYEELVELKDESGLDIPALIPSLNNEIAIIAGLNPSMKIEVPMGDKTHTMDSPRLALMARVSDGALYTSVRELLVKNGLAGMESSANKLRMTAINAPANPVWPLSPVVATDGEFFYLSTHADYVKTLSDAKGPGLRSTEEYKALAKGLPETGNGCLFVSERLTKTFLDIGQAAQENSGGAAMGSPAFKEFFRMKGDQISGSLSVRVNRPDGVLWVGRSSSSPAQTVPALAVAPLAIMAGIAVPNYFEAQTRAKVARTHSDMRSMATALEAFMIDSNSYPVSSSDPSQNLIGRLADQNPTLRSQTTFKIYQPGSRSLSLTTPIAYMTSVPTDVFSQGAPICYYNAGDKGWIVWSAGPDSKYSLSAENIASIYDPAVPQPSAKVLVHAYDPTNGTVSAGDLWRVKQ